MDELNNGLQAQTNEMRILLEQAGDIAGKRAAGIIDDAERIELEARRMACLTVIARNDAGELVSEAEFEARAGGAPHAGGAERSRHRLPDDDGR